MGRKKLTRTPTPKRSKPKKTDDAPPQTVDTRSRTAVGKDKAKYICKPNKEEKKTNKRRGRPATK